MIRPFMVFDTRFAIGAVWLSWPGAESLLRIEVRERAGPGHPEAINHFRINAARARSLRVALAYALAEANGAPEVVVDGEVFALGEATALDAVLASSLAMLDDVQEQAPLDAARGGRR